MASGRLETEKGLKLGPPKAAFVVPCGKVKHLSVTLPGRAMERDQSLRKQVMKANFPMVGN